MDKIEIYVLCKERSKKLVLNFLDEFLPDRKEVNSEYPYPQYVGNAENFNDVDKLLNILEENKNESYSLYWENKTESELQNAMVFYTKDMGMIVGLVIEENECENIFKKLANFVDGDYGYITFESPPPENKSEFINICHNSDQMKLIDGKLEKKCINNQ